jgi:uncharacterized protein YegP (UPF0339 family)
MFTKCQWFLSIAALHVAVAPAMLWGQAKSEDAKGGLAFEVYQDTAKEYRWRLVSRLENEQHVLATGGQGYKAKADCLVGVKSLQTGADKLTFETYEDRAKETRWRAKSSNGQVVAASGTSYKTKSECEKAISAIKKGVSKAPVEEVKPKS